VTEKNNGVEKYNEVVLFNEKRSRQYKLNCADYSYDFSETGGAVGCAELVEISVAKLTRDGIVFVRAGVPQISTIRVEKSMIKDFVKAVLEVADTPKK